MGLLISQRLTSPLRRLTEAAGKMSAGDLSGRVAAKSRDEIGELADTFNQMAERLEASFREVASERDALRRFIADASHKLRTPVAALKNFNALLLGPAANDPEVQSEFPLPKARCRLIAWNGSQTISWIYHACRPA